MMKKKKGFTLVEASAAISIFIIGIAMIIGGYMYLQKNSLEQLSQDKLDMNVGLAVQRLQMEMRLSSLYEMTFYPPSSRKYTAVSFPMLDRQDAESGVWTSTVIYHAFGQGDDQRLLRTEFTPRDNSLTVEERLAQLATVVRDGNGDNAENGANAKTTTLFQHVFDWSIVPQGSAYDGYSSREQRDRTANVGFGIVGPGPHTLQFKVTGKDDQSTGYKIGLDTLKASTSGMEREAEAQSVSGSPVPSVDYNASGTWSGYHQLSFDATATGQTFSVSFYNDRWEDTNFDLSGSTKSNVNVGLPDTNYDPADLVLHLEGDTTNWTAIAQTGDDIGIDAGSGVAFKGAALRVMLRGASMSGGGLLGHDGARCRVAFTAATNALSIEEAYIDEVVESFDVVPNTVGNPMQLTFSSDAGCTIAAGTTAWSDYLNFPIEYDKTYAVTLWVADNETACQPKIWTDQGGITGTFVLSTNTLSSADLVSTNWSTRSEVIALPATVAVSMLHTMYPSVGTYISPAVDTQMDSPQYDAIEWTEDCPPGTSVAIKVRSGSDAQMSDAPAWALVSTVSSPGTLTSVSAKRYVQYQAALYSNGNNSPKLRDIALQWDGRTKMVEVGGVFINGPDYGQFEVTIDGQPLTSPLRVSVVVQEEIRTMNNEVKTVYSTEGFELAPRNTGK
ncbi:MAG: hypothetical protein JXR23_04150 [Pontiellaceae bacterium]|nr:hypothetical protein [Pontiellaceae bacterium]